MNSASAFGWRLAGRCVILLLLVLFCAQVGAAIPLPDYHQRVGQVIILLDSLKEKDEADDESQRATLITASISSVREALPPTLQVEWDGSTYAVNYSWLHTQLSEYEQKSDADPNRAKVLDQILERLQGIDERLREIEKSVRTGAGKDEVKQRLATILQRPEFAGPTKEDTAFASLGKRLRGWLSRPLLRFLEWLRGLMPAPNPGRASTVSRLAQIIVVGVAVLVIAYAVWLFAPRFFRHRQTRKKVKPEARIVLGERLEPDQSAVDLLADAEALARTGDLRGAIRKGYIALLVELADRRVISLAQYKTNRDYLRSVRAHEPLHRNMEKLTSSFEAHWYGLMQASEHDWIDFRTVYRETLS